MKGHKGRQKLYQTVELTNRPCQKVTIDIIGPSPSEAMKSTLKQNAAGCPVHTKTTLILFNSITNILQKLPYGKSTNTKGFSSFEMLYGANQVLWLH